MRDWQMKRLTAPLEIQQRILPPESLPDPVERPSQTNDKEEPKQMTEESLRAVLRVDEKAKAFTPVAHNLSAEKAEAKLNELKNKGVQAQILFQTGRHKGRGLKNCELCKNAAENLSRKPITGVVEEEQNGDRAIENHSDSDG